MKKLVIRTIHFTAQDLASRARIASLHKGSKEGSSMLDHYRLADEIQLGEAPELFHINRDPGADGRTRVWDNEVVEGIQKAGCRPGTVWELLDYSANNPQKLEFPIVAIGSVTRWFCNAEAPILSEVDGKRDLGIAAFGYGLGGFHPSCRFLMFRK